MKKAIATALALLLTSCGYVLVDQKLVDRVTTLESQVQELQAGQGVAVQPTADEWDVPICVDLPCSFTSKNSANVITITNITAHCRRIGAASVTTTARETTTSTVYWQTTTRAETTTEPIYWQTTTSPVTTRRPETTTRRRDTYYGVAPQVEVDDESAKLWRLPLLRLSLR